MSPIHEALAEEVVAVRLRDVGSDTLASLKRTVLDTIGVTALSAPEPFAKACAGHGASLWGETRGGRGCTVVGMERRMSPGAAAMVNGTLGHGFDFDDVHMPSLAHFSTVVIPACLAAAEVFDASGTAFLEAVLAGNEVGGRLGWSFCDATWAGSAIRERGFFPTSILGTIAAAAGVAKLANLTTVQTAHAIAIAMSHAGGMACISRGDNTTKRTQAGWAAQAGLAAAWLAHSGETGPREIFETKNGFLQAFAGGKYHPNKLVRAASGRWVCEEVSFKLYPVEYFIHPFVELIDRNLPALRPLRDRITSIEASTAAPMATVFTPIEAKSSPADTYAALISGPYCIALALSKPSDAPLRLSDFRSTGLGDDDVRSLAAKVQFVKDERFDRRFPNRVGGRMRMLSGQVVLWEGEVDDTYGSAELPMSQEDLRRKFADNCGHWGDRANEVADTVERLQEMPDAAWVRRLGFERGASVAAG